MSDLVTGEVFSFKGSILGFENYDQFQVLPLSEGEPYFYLQSSEDQSVGFLVTSPFWLFKDYEFEISDTERKELDIKKQEDIVVFSIVTIREPFSKSTLNLLAPLIVNVRTKLGKQIVLPTKYNYNTQGLMFPKPVHAEGGDKSC